MSFRVPIIKIKHGEMTITLTGFQTLLGFCSRHSERSEESRNDDDSHAQNDDVQSIIVHYLSGF
ncbi:hypothetical protein FACS189438_0090 [Bacteroidia bacterium]|nr:hypothetical protein FACS189438_0090 [Bacteroidia bacterium]